MSWVGSRRHRTSRPLFTARRPHSPVPWSSSSRASCAYGSAPVRSPAPGFAAAPWRAVAIALSRPAPNIGAVSPKQPARYCAPGLPCVSTSRHDRFSPSVKDLRESPANLLRFAHHSPLATIFCYRRSLIFCPVRSQRRIVKRSRSLRSSTARVGSARPPGETGSGLKLRTGDGSGHGLVLRVLGPWSFGSLVLQQAPISRARSRPKTCRTALLYSWTRRLDRLRPLSVLRPSVLRSFVLRVHLKDLMDQGPDGPRTHLMDLKDYGLWT